MAPVHLSDFERRTLSYYEHERRFCLRREAGTHIRAYDIDVNGPGRQYFREVYHAGVQQGRRSADGIYVGSFHLRGRQIFFILVIELEGQTSFEDSAQQVISTLKHFSHQYQDNLLDDDGVRHHQQALQEPHPYTSHRGHLVAGIVIGSTARQGALINYQGWPIVCLNSRQPVQDKTPMALFEEIASYTGQRFW